MGSVDQRDERHPSKIDDDGRRHYAIRAIPYQDPQQEAERLKLVHAARVKIVPRGLSAQSTDFPRRNSGPVRERGLAATPSGSSAVDSRGGSLPPVVAQSGPEAQRRFLAILTRWYSRHTLQTQPCTYAALVPCRRSPRRLAVKAASSPADQSSSLLVSPQTWLEVRPRLRTISLKGWPS